MHSNKGDDVLNTVTVERMLEHLSPEQRDLITLWMANFSLQEIGRIIGQKYYGRDLNDSVIRYHRNKIFEQLKQRFG